MNKAWRRAGRWLLALFLCLLLLPGPARGETGLRLNHQRLVLPPNAYGHLEVIQAGTAADQPKLTWESGNPAVATVNGGHVRGVKPGRTTVTCTAAFPDGRTERMVCRVEIYRPVDSLNRKEQSITLLTGRRSAPLAVTVAPADAAYPRLVWSSEDESVATVDQQGRVTGLRAGRTTIHATLQEPGVQRQKFAWFQVRVNQAVTDIGLSNPRLLIPRGGTETLTALVFPENADTAWVAWASDNEGVATVKNGRVTGVATGTCTVTVSATDGSGVSASCLVQVTQPVTRVQPGPDPLVVMAGFSRQAEAEIAPADASNPGLYWFCDDGDVARVDSLGVVTGRAPGKCRLWADAADGSEVSGWTWVYVEPASPLARDEETTAAPWLHLPVVNRCAFMTVVNLTCEVTFPGFPMDGTVRAETVELTEDVLLWPGARKVLPLPSVPGAEQAEEAVVTVTAVAFADGSRWEIPEDQRTEWRFTRPKHEQ